MFINHPHTKHPAVLDNVARVHHAHQLVVQLALACDSHRFAFNDQVDACLRHIAAEYQQAGLQHVLLVLAAPQHDDW
jgi:hypothetical protein